MNFYRKCFSPSFLQNRFYELTLFENFIEITLLWSFIVRSFIHPVIHLFNQNFVAKPYIFQIQNTVYQNEYLYNWTEWKFETFLLCFGFHLERIYKNEDTMNFLFKLSKLFLFPWSCCSVFLCFMYFPALLSSTPYTSL